MCRLGLVVYVRLDLRMGVCHQEMLDCPPWDPRLAILRSFDHSSPSQMDCGPEEEHSALEMVWWAGLLGPLCMHRSVVKPIWAGEPISHSQPGFQWGSGIGGKGSSACFHLCLSLFVSLILSLLSLHLFSLIFSLLLSLWFSQSLSVCLFVSSCSLFAYLCLLVSPVPLSPSHPMNDSCQRTGFHAQPNSPFLSGSCLVPWLQGAVQLPGSGRGLCPSHGRGWAGQWPLALGLGRSQPGSSANPRIPRHLVSCTHAFDLHSSDIDFWLLRSPGKVRWGALLGTVENAEAPSVIIAA